MALRPPPAERTVPELLEFGVVNLDKPPGPSAHQVAAWVRDAVDDALEEGGLDRAAHAGTLDPKVTGCLPVLLGDATRLAQVFLEGEKEYVAVLEAHATVPDDLEPILAEFEGEIYQTPPKKSAVRRRRRVRTVGDLEVLERRERQVLLGIRCESGTYVRKLCHDLGLALGTGAHMGDLRRTATEPFDDTTLSTMHDLVDGLSEWQDGDATGIREVVVPAERALAHLPRVEIAESAATAVADGAPVYAPGVIATENLADGGDDEDPLVACYAPTGSAVCLGRLVGDPAADRGTVVDLERVLV